MKTLPKRTKVMLILVTIFAVLSFFYTREGVYLYCPFSEEFYTDGEIQTDNTILKGQSRQVQDKQPGKRHNCIHLIHGRQWKIEKQPVSSIVKIGTKKFQDPQLLAMAPFAGIKHPLSTEPVSLYYVKNYTDHIWAAGQYDNYKKAITVKSDTHLDDQHTTLAHEYLHYVWYRDKLDKDTRLVSELTTFYRSNHDLQFRMKDYAPDLTKPTEFFSFGCTEFTNRHLTPYIVDKCNQYIDRSKLRLYFQ